MSNSKELCIYCVDTYYGQPNFDEEPQEVVEYDNEDIERLSDEDFIERAEEIGQVYTLFGFLRMVEAEKYGARSEIPTNSTIRAYLIDRENPEGEVIRVDDIDEIVMTITNVEKRG